jgi:hypothetical protein
MIKTAFRLASFCTTAGGWALAALSLHIVRTPERFEILTKQRLGIADTYADTRAWTIGDVPGHAAVVRRLIDAEETDLLKNVADPHSRRDLKTQLEDALQKAPPRGTVVSAGPISFTLPY